MVDGEPRVFSNVVQKVNGTHKAFKMLFGVEAVKDVVTEREWKDMLLDDRIKPFPADSEMEKLSDRIGETPDGMDAPDPLTPQEALSRAIAHLRYMNVTGVGAHV